MGGIRSSVEYGAGWEDYVGLKQVKEMEMG